MKTKLLRKIQKSFSVVKPGGLIKRWIAFENKSMSPYWVVEEVCIEIFIYRLLCRIYSVSKAHDLICKNEKRADRYSKCFSKNH